MSGQLVWITGAGGLIGAELVRSASDWAPGMQPRGLSHDDIELLDSAAVEALFRAERPGAIIHCAAVSRSVVCEGQPELARRTNVEATRVLSELAADIPFLFFSTDLIFDGETGDYLEEHSPNPLSVYGETKAAAEEVVRQYPRHCIVRISLTGGKSPRGDRGFNEEMKNAWRAGKSLNLFVDEFRCPTAAAIVARAVWELVSKSAAGTFHLCSPDKVSRYELGRLLAERHPE
jgi:dTDP-4-dehydrorhamnose reductase